MTKGTLRKTMLITLLSVISLCANPMELAAITPPGPIGGFQAIQDQAQYPAAAKEARFEGEVLLRFRVEKNGDISNMQIIESGGYLLNESAIQAVMNTEWIPASLNKQKIPITFELPFKFIIE